LKTERRSEFPFKRFCNEASRCRKTQEFSKDGADTTSFTVYAPARPDGISPCSRQRRRVEKKTRLFLHENELRGDPRLLDVRKAAAQKKTEKRERVLNTKETN